MRVLRLLAAVAAFARLVSPAAVGAQTPVPKAPVPRVDSVRVDTLRPPAADSAKRVLLPKPPTVTDTVKKPGLFGPNSDLGVDVHTRIEAKGERFRDERCNNGLLSSALANSCQTPFTPAFGFNFTMVSTGTVADRVHVNIDYDTQREFDASNAVNIYYEGKPADRLQRLEVGNVSFVLPSTRFLSSGVPSGNYGLQAVAKFGRFRFQGIAAQQKGNIVQDRVFYVGERTLQSADREIKDNEIEPRRFFFTVDPLLFKGAYPNIDILNRAQLARLASALPDTIRPRRIVLYRVQFGTQPQNPNGPRFRLIGDPGEGRQTYDVLREGVDYYLDPSQLWFALVRPLNQSNERLVVAYTVLLNGRETVFPSTGGTPDLQYAGAASDQRANLIYDPNVLPGSAAFRREIRSVYRIAGEELVRSSTRVRIVSGAGEQEKPAVGTFATFLQMLGLAQPVNSASFDIENRLWPRPSDPNYSAAAGGTAGLASAASLSTGSLASAASSGRIIRDHFVVFPSLRPFAGRDSGLVVQGNPTNEAVYTSPGEYLYSTQHPPNVYRLKVGYSTEASADAGAIMLGSVQVRRGSERVLLDGRPLIRDVDYRVDYELGRLTFARPETLFTRQRAVTVKFEENPLFAVGATKLYGLTSTLSLSNGELNLIAVQQSQATDFTRPQLGFEPVSSLLAGVNGQLSWEVSPITRLVNKLPFVNTKAPSRISVQGEFATSRPQVNSNGQAYIESFEGEAGITVNLSDQAWALSSQPADGHLLPRRYGANPFDLRRASTVAFQNNGTNPTSGANVLVQHDSIDSNASFLGIGSASYETLLWMTLYPLNIGGRYDPATRTGAWTIANTPSGRRYRSVRTVLSPAGVDLSRVEDLEFWALVDTTATRRTANPTLIFDLGEISENRIAFAPETLYVRPGQKPDSLFRGRKPQGIDSLDTERDPISRAFNADVNDKGLLGDVVDTLAVDAGGSISRAFNVPLCNGTSRTTPRLGDTRTNCTVRNNRLDEEDIDLDGVLNLKTAQRDQERLLRFVVDLGDSRKWVRFGKSFRQQIDSAGPVRTLQWVLVRIPFRAADDTLNDVLLRRVRALRVTMVSGAGAADDEFIQTPIARLKLTGAPWLKRNEQTLSGIAGERRRAASRCRRSSARRTRFRAATTISRRRASSTKPTRARRSSPRPPFRSTSGRCVFRRATFRCTAAPRRSTDFPNGQQSFMGYQQLRLWARGRRNGWGTSGELQMYVKVGRDANNFYLYRTPVNSGPGVEAWNPEVRVDFNRFFALRQKLQNAYLANKGDTLQCSGIDAAMVNASATPMAAGQQRYVACDGGYMVYTVEPGAAPPNLAAVQEMAVGFVRLPTTAGAPSQIGPADSLELWVDDIRLGKVVNSPGYAGQVSVALSAADIADIRVGFTKKDPNFRQLTDQPSFVDERVLDVVGTLHLEKLLPVGLGLSMPLTITHVSSASTPLFLSGTDVRGAGVDNLRAPRTGVTTYALSVRRTAAMTNPLLGALVDNLGTHVHVHHRRQPQRVPARQQRQLRTEPRLQRRRRSAHGASARSVRAAHGHRAGCAARRCRHVQCGSGLPLEPHRVPLLERRGARQRSSLHLLQARRRARRLGARLAQRPESLAQLEHARVPSDWRAHGAMGFRLAARPARLRRHYGRVARRHRAARPSVRRERRHGARAVAAHVLRLRAAAVAVVPSARRLRHAVRHAARSQLRSLAQSPLSFGNTVTVTDSTLPRRITVSQNLGAGVTIDLGRMLTIYGADSSLARRLAKVFAPFDITVNRSLLSAFDGASAGSPLGLQFGLGGVDAFREVNGQLAATTGLTQALSASQSFLFPGNIAFVNRYRRTTTRSWTRRIDDAQSVADGAQTVFPDVSFRWNWTPPAAVLPVFKSVGANAGYARSLATSFLPGDEFGQRSRAARLARAHNSAQHVGGVGIRARAHDVGGVYPDDANRLAAGQRG